MEKVILQQEGSSSIRPPLLVGASNYSYWKARMTIFLCSLGEGIWEIIEEGFTAPTVTVEGVVVPKPKDKLTDTDKALSLANFKALNAIFGAVDAEQFKTISSYKTAKEAWDALQSQHEGNENTRLTKLLTITTQFENLKMEEHETISQYHHRLSAVGNESFYLGERIPETSLVRKMLRTLPKRFDMKVTALKELKDIDKMSLDQLTGFLRSYELEMLAKDADFNEKEKHIAFTGVSGTVTGKSEGTVKKNFDIQEKEKPWKNKLLILLEISKSS